MLRTAVGLFFASLIALAGSAEARVTVIYPPQSYQSPFQDCPRYWNEPCTTDCYDLHSRHRHRFDRDDIALAAPVSQTQVNVQVIRSRRARTLVIVAPGHH